MRSVAPPALALACLAGLIASPTRAAESPETPRLVVFDLEAKGVPPALARNLTDALLAALAARPGYRVLGRSEIALLMEHEGLKQQTSCSDDSCLAEMGEALKGDLLVSGTVGAVGNTFLVTVRMLDVKRAVVTARTSATAMSPDELAATAGRLAAELVAPGEAGVEAAPRFKLELGDEGEVKVAVLDLQASGPAAAVAENLTQVIALDLKQVERLSVISRDEIRTMIAFEGDKQALGCDDDSCLAEIGGALGVQYLVSGNVGLMGDTYLLHLKLLDIKEARTENRVAESFRGEESQLLGAARFAVRALFGFSTGGEGDLEVRPAVGDARLFLDGEEVDLAKRKLPAGKHNLRVEADGFYPWIGDVYVDRGDLTRLDVSLDEMPRPLYREWWLWTVVGVVVAGGVATALYFGLRPEDARSGNLEVLADVPGVTR